ncbi:MAG TPA: non-canonical purine NTP pyrophosphatase [Candidatus Saccharimonadales bacterium]|jgi:non-canonical purine NTP pyrophosphatase (RdgB/HAM1 family)
MNPITLVTGNPHKLAELQKVFPSDMTLQSMKLDLDEIQSLDVHQIVRHKLHQAYETVGTPVIIEDVSAELAVLNGLPGPFVKFFEERLGRGALYKLAGETAATIICSMGYYDGTQEYIVDGIIQGRIVAPREGEGFGFDVVFIPDGYDKTLSELGMDVKNTISHRFKAATLLAEKIASGTTA